MAPPPNFCSQTCDGTPARDGTLTWHRSPCLGLCERAPAALFTFAGDRPLEQALGPVDAVGVMARLEATPDEIQKIETENELLREQIQTMRLEC